MQAAAAHRDDPDAAIANAVRLLRRSGVNYADASARMQRALQREYQHGLSEAEWAALREPTAKHHTDTLERMAGAGIAAAQQLERGVVRCSFDAVGVRTRQQRHETLYVQDRCARFADVVAELDGAVLLNATARNLGWDLGAVRAYDLDEHTLELELRQLKLGTTPIGASERSDRSMVAVARKLREAEEHLEQQLVEICDDEIEVRFVRTLDTTAALAGDAANVAHRDGITVNDAQALWRNVWLPQHRDAAVALYGRDRAPYLAK